MRPAPILLAFACGVLVPNGGDEQVTVVDAIQKAKNALASERLGHMVKREALLESALKALMPLAQAIDPAIDEHEIDMMLRQAERVDEAMRPYMSRASLEFGGRDIEGFREALAEAQRVSSVGFSYWITSERYERQVAVLEELFWVEAAKLGRIE